MDRLDKILQDMQAPPADENAKKRAVNLALAEFDNQRKEKEKKRQGFSLLRRLTDSSNKRRTVMNSKRLVYGGTATAMALVLAVGLSFNYMGGQHNNSGARFSGIADNLAASPAWLGGKESADKSMVVAQLEKAPGSTSVSETYKKAVQEKNEQRVEEAISTGKSAIPVPTEAPVGTLPIMNARQLNEQKQDAGAPASALMAASDSLARADQPVKMKALSAPASVGAIAMNDEEPAPSYYKDVGRDQFEHKEDNPVKVVAQEPVSTFSTDVDTSSYSFTRRQINQGVLPQKDAVRIEEMVNYFDYSYPLPETKEQPFKPAVAVEPCPWKKGDKLIHIGIKGYDIAPGAHPHSNLVFLLDTSGSMDSPDKLPLVVQSLKMLLDTLQPDDTVAIVTYAGNAGTALEPTAAREKEKIVAALDNLGAGGSTAGAEGIRQAYNLAEAHFDKKSVNRVILATDGDFNVGITNTDELKSFIERERQTGIFLSVLGFGEGNLNDKLMQDLAQNGNGIAAYIDNLNEARKVLVKEATSTLFPIAKDVKIQVEFNPQTVSEYRLIGYETRALNREDFNNDKVDAGDIGAGHAVTALYEITPKEAAGNRMVDESRYNPVAASKGEAANDGEYAFLKIRYKLPDEDASKLITTPITKADELTGLEKVGGWQATDPGWAAAVAGFGQILKGGKFTGDFSYDDVITLAQNNKGADEYGYRSEFIQLVRLAKSAAAMQKN